MTPGQIRVSIFGTEYSLIAENDESYIKEIARYVDEKMREIDNSQSLKSSMKVAVLAALNIADELYQERAYREKLLNQLNEEARKLNRSLIDVIEE